MRQNPGEAVLNLSDYRASTQEQDRTQDLLELMPATGSIALDIGARDGHFSLLMAERFEQVIALDLHKPNVNHLRVQCVEGNAARLDLPDASVDFVFCAEVLEHLCDDTLTAVCNELQRVCNGQLLIGVPYRQDIRVGRTTCYHCLGKNPPWGHVNQFDEYSLAERFPHFHIEKKSFVGHNADETNALSALLLDLAGNPYGTYEQEEGCIHCGRPLIPPPERNLGQKILTKAAYLARDTTALFNKPHANWIHVLFSKNDAARAVAPPAESRSTRAA